MCPCVHEARNVSRVKLQKSHYLRESCSAGVQSSGSSGLKRKLKVRKEDSKCRQAFQEAWL